MIPDYREKNLNGFLRFVSVLKHHGPEWWAVFKPATVRLFIGRDDGSPKDRFLDLIMLHAFFNWFIEPMKYDAEGREKNGYIHGHFLGVVFIALALTVLLK